MKARRFAHVAHISLWQVRRAASHALEASNAKRLERLLPEAVLKGIIVLAQIKLCSTQLAS